MEVTPLLRSELYTKDRANFFLSFAGNEGVVAMLSGVHFSRVSHS